MCFYVKVLKLYDIHYTCVCLSVCLFVLVRGTLWGDWYVQIDIVGLFYIVGWTPQRKWLQLASRGGKHIKKHGITHLKLRGQNIDPFMGSISFNPFRGQINHDLGHFL